MSQPERTCAGCVRRRPQSSLVRLAVGADGALLIGARGGRGAYVCPDRACAERVRATRALPRRLRAEIALPDDFEDLVVAAGLEGRKPGRW